MKITAKTTRQELKDILNANVKAVKEQDSNLYDRIIYTGKMSSEDDSKVTKKELVDLVKEVINLLGDNFIKPVKEETPSETTTETTETPTETPVAPLEAPVEPKAENSVKKLHKSKKKAENATEAPVETPVETPTETPVEESKTETTESVDKKSAKKSSKLGSKKNTTKKDGDTVLKEETVQEKVIFPQILELEDGSKYELVPNIKNMDDLYNLSLEEEKKNKQVVFAFHWSKAHLKQFQYFGHVLGKVSSFEKDLDLATCVYISNSKVVSYCLSMYTEAFYTVLPDDIEEIEGVRYANGVDYQIYRII